MPDKDNFQAVINTAPTLTKQLSEQSGQDLGQPGALVVAEVDTGGADEIVVIDRAAFNQGANALFDVQIEISQTNPTVIAKGANAVCYRTT